MSSAGYLGKRTNQPEDISGEDIPGISERIGAIAAERSFDLQPASIRRNRRAFGVAGHGVTSRARVHGFCTARPAESRFVLPKCAEAAPVRPAP